MKRKASQDDIQVKLREGNRSAIEVFMYICLVYIFNEC